MKTRITKQELDAALEGGGAELEEHLKLLKSDPEHNIQVLAFMLAMLVSEMPETNNFWTGETFVNNDQVLVVTVQYVDGVTPPERIQMLEEQLGNIVGDTGAGIQGDTGLTGMTGIQGDTGTGIQRSSKKVIKRRKWWQVWRRADYRDPYANG